MKCFCSDIRGIKKNDCYDVSEMKDKSLIRLEDIPEKCGSLAVLISDRSRNRIYWMVYNLPVGAEISLHETRGRSTVNDFYRHSIVIPGIFGKSAPLCVTVFALDSMLSIGGGKHARDILKIMKPNIIEAVSDSCKVYNVNEKEANPLSRDSVPLGIHD